MTMSKVNYHELDVQYCNLLLGEDGQANCIKLFTFLLIIDTLNANVSENLVTKDIKNAIPGPIL